MGYIFLEHLVKYSDRGGTAMSKLLMITCAWATALMRTGMGGFAQAIPLAMVLSAILFLTACQSTSNVRTGTPPSNAETGTTLTVMSYNIRMGVGSQRESGSIYHMPWGKNIEAVIKEIKLVEPDIIGLQEVAGVQQASKLGNALNMNYAYVGHHTARRDGSWWGVAILSKFPILKSRGVDISFGPSSEKSMIVATLDMGGRTATFFSVHKDRDLTDGASIDVVVDVASRIEGPIVLIGDFNIAPTESNGRLEGITERFQDTAIIAPTKSARVARNAGTFYYSGRRIDYVFSDPRFFIVKDAAVTQQEVPGSDHLSYFAKLQWK